MKKRNASSDKKSVKKNLLLSVVALVEILLLMVVSTYAWVETVSTIRIYTSNSAEAKQPASATGQFLTHLFQKATFNAASSSAIDLSQMYHESGKFHLAPASSADGKAIFFPHYQPDGSMSDYRKADSSDNMVNYVSFSFKVAAAGYYVFNANPTFSFGNSNNLVRVSLQVGSGTPMIYSKTASTTAVVNSITGGTGSTSVKAFSSYVGGNGNYAMRTTAANQIVTVRIWIQDPTHTSSSTYTGKQLSISNLKLVPAYPVTTYVTLNKTAASSNSPAGTVKSGNASASYKSVAYVKHGASVTLTATNSDAITYTFNGWGIAANSTSYENTSLSYSKTNVTAAITRYAHFYTKVSISANAVLNTGSTASTTYGKVLVSQTNSGTPTEATSTVGIGYGTTFYLRSVASSGYTFVGWYDGTGSGATRLSTSVNYSPGTATTAKTYYARYMKNPTITANAVLGTNTTPSATYGTVSVGSATAGATSTGTVTYNGNVTLTATPTSNYAVVGWYKGTPSSSTFVANSNGLTSLTVNNVTADATYYCSFKQKKTTTIYFMDRGYNTKYSGNNYSESKMFAYVVGSSTNHEYSGSWPGTCMDLDKSRGLYKFEFLSAEDENVQVIVSDGNGTQYPASGQSGLTGTIGNTYLFGVGSPSSLTSFTLGSKKYVYFSNNKGWTNLHCYYTNGGSGWPGNTMTVAYTTNNETKYYKEVTTSSTIVFNNNGNGANQTVDISGSANQCRYYLLDTYTDGKRNVGTW